MPKRSSSKKRKSLKISLSGAKGGPSTGHGLNYQIDFAIEQTLDYISRALCAPHRIWEVMLEPRVSASGVLTAWDVGFNPDNSLFEIKLKPTREDIQEWVERCAVDGNANPARKFYLVYSKGAGKHLDNLDRLIRIAVEANGKENEFRTKVDAEGIIPDDPYLARLGMKAHELLGRMIVDQEPEYRLKENIEFRARQLAGESGGRRLREYLFKKFHEAVPQRGSFSIIELIEEARGLEIQFQTPAPVDTSDISKTANAALIIMQACKQGIPSKVIADALNCTESDIEIEIHDLKESRVVTLDEGLWSMKPLPTAINAVNEQDILARALSSLLSFIDSTPVNTNILPHVDNVIALAKKCRTSHAALVASVFTRLDKNKRVKRIGNKRLVWFVAHLSIKAAREIRDRDRDVVEAEARALICGTSWAFQRLHKVEKARMDANDAYKLACDMRLDRTLAFCLKCLGRLCRMEAEPLGDGEDKQAKLEESKSLLQQAIQKFEQLAEFGPSHPEVGDCYSLLGRTYLNAKELHQAEDAIRKAHKLIVDETSKDYVDLIILSGDFEVASGNRKEASGFYDTALQVPTGSDPELSEMRARAFFQRASNREMLGDKAGARADYQSAKQIWTSLHDEEFAARAAWKTICLDDSLSKHSLDLLSKEVDIKVRVEAVNMHLKSLHQSKQTAMARRSEPPSGYWKQLIIEAKERLALRGQRSETEW